MNLFLNQIIINYQINYQINNYIPIIKKVYQ